jgi:hypothetical protein
VPLLRVGLDDARGPKDDAGVFDARRTPFRRQQAPISVAVKQTRAGRHVLGRDWRAVM